MSPHQRMSNAQLLAAVSTHLARIDAIGRELDISPERMGWSGASWPLRCARQELAVRVEEDRKRMLAR